MIWIPVILGALTLGNTLANVWLAYAHRQNKVATAANTQAIATLAAAPGAPALEDKP